MSEMRRALSSVRPAASGFFRERLQRIVGSYTATASPACVREGIVLDQQAKSVCEAYITRLSGHPRLTSDDNGDRASDSDSVFTNNFIDMEQVLLCIR